MHLNTALGMDLHQVKDMCVCLYLDFFSQTFARCLQFNREKNIVQGVLTLAVPARSYKSAPLPWPTES